MNLKIFDKTTKMVAVCFLLMPQPKKIAKENLNNTFIKTIVLWPWSASS